MAQNNYRDLMSLYPVDPRTDYSQEYYGFTGGSEIDLRGEFMATIFGAGSETPKGRPMLLRRLRRDPITFARQKCACVSSMTNEPDRDTICVYCHGVGFYWDEELISGYSVEVGADTTLAHRVEHTRAGQMQQSIFKYWLPYFHNVLEGDMIVELVLDVEGRIAAPARRKAVYYPTTIENKRLDRGRTEFFILSCPSSNIILIDKAEYSYINNPIG